MTWRDFCIFLLIFFNHYNHRVIL